VHIRNCTWSHNSWIPIQDFTIIWESTIIHWWKTL